MRSFWIKIVLALILLVTIVSLSANHLLSSWLGGELVQILNKDSNRKYDIVFTDFSLNIVNKSITINNVSVIPISNDSIKTPIVSVKRFELMGVSFQKLISSKEIVTKTLRITEPEVNFRVNATQKVIGDSKEINLLWNDILPRINVENFEIHNGSVTIYDNLLDRKQLSMHPINLRITDIVIDTTTIDDPFPLNYNTIDFAAENLEIEFDKFFLEISRFDATEYSLIIKELQLLPKKEVKESQEMTISSQSIEVSHFNWGFLEEQFFLRIRKLKVNNTDLTVLQNRAAVQYYGEKPLLSSMLRQLPFQLHMDTVTLRKSKIAYEQLNAVNNAVGRIEFDNFYASVYNITNDQKALIKAHYTVIDMETDFMKSGHLKSQFNFDLTDKNDSFTGIGTLNRMDLSEFNSILNPIANVNVNGQMDSFDFNIKGNKWKSTGTLDFVYDHFKVEVYDQEKQKKKVLLSGLSKLVIRGSNQQNMPNYKTGSISASRIRNKSFFTYLWSSLKSGILDVVAPSMKKDKKKKRRRNK